MPGARADSTTWPGSAASKRRATISISGSSGIQCFSSMDDWVGDGAREIAARAERELDALVAVSSPSGDVNGAEEAVRVAPRSSPDQAEFERMPCSSDGYAPDLLAAAEGHRLPPHPVDRPPGHRASPRGAQAGRARRRQADRLRGDRHEGRRRAGAGRAARARPAHRLLRRGRSAARKRRGVAGRRPEARGVVRGLGRVPVLRGRRADARPATTGSWSSARPRARCASRRTAARRTRVRRRTRAATPCWRWPPRRRRSARATTRRGPSG